MFYYEHNRRDFKRQHMQKGKRIWHKIVSRVLSSKNKMIQPEIYLILIYGKKRKCICFKLCLKWILKFYLVFLVSHYLEFLRICGLFLMTF